MTPIFPAHWVAGHNTYPLAHLGSRVLGNYSRSAVPLVGSRIHGTYLSAQWVAGSTEPIFQPNG